MDIVKACGALHNFPCKRDNYKFEDAMVVTGLEHIPVGQAARGGRGGFNSEQCEE